MNIITTPLNLNNKYNSPSFGWGMVPPPYTPYNSSLRDSNILEVLPEIRYTENGFKTDKSKIMSYYNGPRGLYAGFSTEAGGYGGGYIINSMDTPLSTKDLHDGVLLNLVNKNNNQQMLYNVYSTTDAQSIERLIQSNIHDFNQVNIMLGDSYKTKSTLKNVLSALNNVGNNPCITFYHSPIKNPEVVAHNGELYCLNNYNYDRMTFYESCNYNY